MLLPNEILSVKKECHNERKEKISERAERDKRGTRCLIHEWHPNAGLASRLHIRLPRKRAGSSSETMGHHCACDAIGNGNIDEIQIK